jgi:hypothetical protein
VHFWIVTPRSWRNSGTHARLRIIATRIRALDLSASAPRSWIPPLLWQGRFGHYFRDGFLRRHQIVSSRVDGQRCQYGRYDERTRRRSLSYVNDIYEGGFLGQASCDAERRSNPVRTLTLFNLESINGFTKIVCDGKAPLIF